MYILKWSHFFHYLQTDLNGSPRIKGRNKAVSHLETQKHNTCSFMETKIKKCKAFTDFSQKSLKCGRNMCEIWAFIYPNRRNLSARVKQLTVDGKD